MAKATHFIVDHDNFEGVVWETKIGRIITMKGNINPQMGFSVYEAGNDNSIVSSDMIDVLAEILPFDKENKLEGDNK